MEQKIIVTRKILMQPSGVGYGRDLTMAFLKKYDIDLGGQGKPRRYDLELVDDFLHRHFRKGLQQQQDAGKKVADLKRYIEQKIGHERSKVLDNGKPGQILGEGGRIVA